MAERKKGGEGEEAPKKEEEQKKDAPPLPPDYCGYVVLDRPYWDIRMLRYVLGTTSWP